LLAVSKGLRPSNSDILSFDNAVKQQILQALQQQQMIRGKPIHFAVTNSSVFDAGIQVYIIHHQNQVKLMSAQG